MKKMLFAFVIVILFIITGLSSASSIGFSNNKIYNFEFNNNIFEFEANLPKFQNIENSDIPSWGLYIHKYGIKIWSRGYGVVNSDTIEKNCKNYEFIEGKNGDDVWRVHIWPPETQGEFYRESKFNYHFYDDDAETRINAVLCNFPITVILLNMIRPGLVDKFRRNSKIPFIGTGSHELRSGYFFNGTITKGQTYNGTLMEPIPVDSDGDGIKESNAHYYEILAKVDGLYHVQKGLDITSWEFWKTCLNRLFFWKDPNFIPYDI